MFGKKKEKKYNFSNIRVMHYEGLNFPTNFPCVLNLTESALTITRRVMPDVTVTLPINQIRSFSCMAEPEFTLKYHGQAVNTSKMNGIIKQFLVVEYTTKDGSKEWLAFWGTAKEGRKFLNMQYHGLPEQAQNYSL